MLKRISLVWPIVKNFFHRNLRCYWYIFYSFDSSYNARGVKYAEKSFMKFAAAGPVFGLMFLNKLERLVQLNTSTLAKPI